MFSTESNTSLKIEENRLKKWYRNFSSQPHQPFFTSGISFLVLFIFLLSLSFSNTITLDNQVLDYHGYTMIFVVFIQFFLGFLYITFPKFLRELEIEKKVYMRNFLFFFSSSVGIFISLFFSLNILFFLFTIMLFITQVFSFRILFGIYKNSKLEDKYDTKWILIFFGFGLLSHLLFISSLIDSNLSLILKHLSINMGFYLFLFGLIFTVSQRMIPFFTSMKVQGYVVNKSKNFIETVFLFLFLKVFILTFLDYRFNIISDIPLFILFTKELFKWKLPAFKTIAIMWVLHISLYWIPFAFFISILESINALFAFGFFFEKATVHVLAIGYFLTVLIGFGTRVILGHSGQTPHADKFTIFIFIAVQFIVLFRLFSSLSSNFNLDYISFINASAILLILGLLAWSSKYLKILILGK